MNHFVPQNNWEETQVGINEIMAGRKLLNVETRRYTKSGQLVNVIIRGAVYHDPSGQPIGSVIAHRDVSDLRSLEKQVSDFASKPKVVVVF